MKTLRRIGVGLVAAVALWSAWFWWGPGIAPKGTRVVIPEGAALQSATDQLHYAGAIRNRFFFYYFARLLGEGDPVQAGTFEIPAGASYSTVLDIVQHGRPVVQLLTIPEGMPSILVQEKLAAVDGLSGTAPLPAEGSVLPDSYDWKAGEDRAAVLKRMTDAMAKALKEEWAAKGPNTVARTPEEAIILASIVEKETGKADERPMVAGVLSNRLRIGMALGADATTIYPVTKGKPLGRMIRKSELAADNGYNTRRRSGLPIGPITNPGRDAIHAALHPAKTDALYYVADGKGGHVFANTLAEHNANVAKWREFRKKKGI